MFNVTFCDLRAKQIGQVFCALFEAVGQTRAGVISWRVVMNSLLPPGRYVSQARSASEWNFLSRDQSSQA